MATTDVEKLLVRLEANLTQYERSFAKAQGVTVSSMRKIEREVQNSATRVEGSFAKMGNTFKNFGKGLLIGAGIGGASALGNFVQETISQTAKIGDLADKLGLGTDALQELQYGAVQADMSFQDMEKSLLRFSKTLGEAANGQGEYLKTLRANNQQIQGSFLGNLRQLADLVANAKNEQEGLLLVTQAMGKGSDGMLEFLRDGSAGFDKFATDAQNANAVIKEASVRTAQEIDDRWAALMQSLSQMTKSTVIDIVDMFDSLATSPNTEKILSAREKILRQGTRFGNGQSPVTTGPVAGSGPEMGRPPVGTNRPTTKISNPEEEAEKARLAAEKAAAAKKRLAEAAREAKRAEDELTNSLERQFEAFTGDLTRTDEEIARMRLEAETLGLSTGEIERHRMAQELMNSANQAGIPITAGLNAVIQHKALAYGDAAQALEDLYEQQAAVEERDAAFKDSIKSFAADIRAGIDPIEAMTDALGRLADRLTDLALDMALNSLFKPGATGGGTFASLAALVSHKGGVVGSGGPRRAVHPGVFAGARRMHRGGIAGDEVPTILQKGEIVLPKGFKGGRGGGSDLNVNIYDNAGISVRAEKTKNQSGRYELNLAIDHRVADPYSGAAMAMSARGAKNPVKRR